MPDRAVFISHAHQDAEIARELCARLEAAGVACWIAPRNMRAGADWSATIPSAIDACRAMVLILSSGANASRQIAHEAHLAHENGIPIVPVRVEAVEPQGALRYLLSGVHYVDALGGSREDAYAEVAGVLHRPDEGGEPVPARTLRQCPWLVPTAMRTRYFTGREELLERLRRALLERHRAALSGLGGVGKSQAAIEYATRHRAEYPAGVFWVNAETAAGLTGGFAEIAAALRLPSAESNSHELTVRAVLAWLDAEPGWLLILDNVDDRRGVQPFVPESLAGDVLITSRDTVFPELGIPRALEVGDLDAAEAIAFLLRRAGREGAVGDERAAAGEIAAEVGNLPLALEQAAAYVAETDASLTAYLAALRKRRVSLLEKAGALLSHETVAATWVANFDAVEKASPVSAEISRIASLVAPDAIPFELFLQGAPEFGEAVAEAFADPDDLAIAEALRPLARYSLIRSDATSRTFGVHRLVQEIVRESIGEAQRAILIERATRAFDRCFPTGTFETWPQCERLVGHVAAISKWIEALGTYSDAAGNVLNRAAAYLAERARYEEARALAEMALALAERNLGAHDPQVARVLNRLAVIAWMRGEYAQAQSLDERALEIRERALGPDHPDVATNLNTLAIVHAQLGRFAEALPLFERSLPIRERAYGPDHPLVAHTLSNLANVQDELGRIDEALRLHQKALDIRERRLGPHHPDVGGGLNNIAGILRRQGRFEEARAAHQRALAIVEAALGPRHPDVGYSLNGLGNVTFEGGDLDGAEQLFRRALELRERISGADHPSLVESLLGLANIAARRGRYDEADCLFERAIAIQQRAFGEDHVYVGRTKAELAKLREERNRAPEAPATDRPEAL